jgi:PAS domain S-box-containing protein
MAEGITWGHHRPASEEIHRGSVAGYGTTSPPYMETMSSRRLGSQLAEDYEAVLRDYLDGSGKAGLERAYELGLRARADGLSALDMARVHHQTLLKVSPPRLTREWWGRTVKAAEKLFVKSMKPFETTECMFRETYAALRVSEARYRELVENAHDIIFTVDLDGNFTSINRAGERLSGYERHEALAMKFMTIVAPECVEVACRARELKLQGDKEVTQYELDMVTKDGHRIPLEVNTRLIYQDGKPVGVQGVARDITERKQADQALRRLNARLEEEARKLAHLLHDEAGQLLASVYLAVADIASELPTPARERLEKVSLLLDQVTEQLRRLSHELRPICLDDLGLVPALEFLAQGVSKRTGLSVTIEAAMEERPPASIETALYRIIQETLTNAGRHAQARHVAVLLQQDDGMISCSVGDDGVGFDPSAVDRNRDHSGLGLVGIRERLAGLGGTLSIRTGLDCGTTLDMKIPLKASSLAAPTYPGRRPRNLS